MKNIKEIITNLENFKKSRGADLRTYTKIQNNLKELELESETREKELAFHREKSDRYLRDSILLKQEKEALSAQVALLAKEKSKLESRLEVMQRERPTLSSANLIGTFKTSLSEMNLGLKKAPERTKYHVSSMNVKLRANLALDGTELKFQMPKADDIVPSENLSEIEFTVQELPEKAGPVGYREVPDLAGLSLEAARVKLQETGFRTGEILEKESRAPQGAVLAQLPSAHSLAGAKAPVDLVISRLSSVKVPNLLGLELESAIEVLKKSKLGTGPIKKQVADAKPGIIIAQSHQPGAEVKAGIEIGFVVSVKKPASPGKEAEKTTAMKIEKEKEKEMDSAGLREKAEERKKVGEEKKPAGESTQIPRPGPIRNPPTISRVKTPVGVGMSVKKIPKLVGLPLKKAVETLKNGGIKLGKVSEINSRVLQGTVVEQSPKTGAIANPKIPVDLIVSKGNLRPTKDSLPRKNAVSRSGSLS